MDLLTNLTSWLTPTTLFLFLNFTIGTIFFTTRFGSKKHHPVHGSHAPAPPFARAPSFTERVKSFNFHLYNNSHPSEPEIHLSGSSDPDPNPTLLQRVKSINFRFPKHNPDADYAAYELQTGPDDTKRVDPIDNSGSEIPEPSFVAPSLLQRVKSIKLPSLYRSEPDQIAGEEKPAPSPKTVKKRKKKAAAVKKMTKSASERVIVGYAGGEKEEETVEAVEKRRPETMRVERTTSIGDEGVDDKASDFIEKFKQQLKLQRLDSFLRYRDTLKNQ